MPFWLNLALKELRIDRGFTLAFILNLSLGLIGFLALDAFKLSIDESLSLRSRSILAADIGLTQKRAFNESEAKIIDQNLPEGAVLREEIGLFTMASSQKRSRLVEVRAVDQHFPFYGELELTNNRLVGSNDQKSIVTNPNVWIYPELAVQLEIEIGDEIAIGSKQFKVKGLVESDPSVSSIALSASPRVYMGLNFLKETELIQYGSRVQFSKLYKVPKEVDLENLSERLQKEFSGTDIKVRTHRTASRELGVLLSYLNDYLSLVAMVALFLAAVGTAYLFRSFMLKRNREIAILLSLGYHYRQVQLVYIALLLILGSLSTVFSLLVTMSLLPFLPSALGELMLEDIQLKVPFQSMFLAFGMGLGGSFLFCLPFLLRLKKVKPMQLFRESGQVAPSLNWASIMAWIPSILVYWLLAVWQSKSWKIGSLFVLLFLVSSLILGVLGFIGLKLSSNILKYNHHFIFKQAILNLARYKLSTLTCFIAIGLSAMLFNLIPQMRVVVEDQISTPDSSKAPSLFVFDIQPEQLEDLKKETLLQGVKVDYLSPVIRARLVDFSGREAKQKNSEAEGFETREEAMEERLQQRAYNLSSREEFSSSEKIVGGRAFKGVYDWDGDALPEVSLEIRFAKRLKINLGDTMTFDIQGVEIEGKVVSFRKVKWTSFHPNFFVMFQAGVLDDAPKTYIASIAGLNFEKKVLLQNSLVDKFPNISIIDITQTIKRLLGLIDQMTSAINFMALLSALASIGVIFSITRHQTQLRQKDFNLFKVLGASLSDILKMVFVEFSLLGFSAAICGVLISISASYALAYVVFDRAWAMNWTYPILVISLTVILSTSIAWLATRKTLQLKALRLLNS